MLFTEEMNKDEQIQFLLDVIDSLSDTGRSVVPDDFGGSHTEHLNFLLGVINGILSERNVLYDYLAIDKDGEMHTFEQMPSLEDSFWEAQPMYDSSFVGEFIGDADWRCTLIELGYQKEK